MRTGRLLVSAGLALLLVQGCSAAGGRATGTVSPSRTRTPLSATAPTTAGSLPSLGGPEDVGGSPLRRPTRTVAGVFIAAGVEQWLSCRGAGPVTVVVIPGLGADSAAWATVLPSLQRVTRVCSYDRPGLGRSPARPRTSQVVDARLYAIELDALLRAAGEPGPYVLLGHSFGGLVARALVHQDPAEVAALLLAESVTPGDPTLARFWVEAGHDVNMSASSAATGGGPHLGGLPLLILSASSPGGDHLGGPSYGQPSWMINLWRVEQHRDLALSSDALQVIATSGHVVQQDDPAAVVEAVRELVRAASSGTRLACSTVWARVHATCRQR